jgi:pimeloyl-ACP methyl ester carboxylesterase
LSIFRPIVALHGWQDNAGTFDALIPLLPDHISFLTLDLPGHGLSTWIPNGMSYHSLDNLLLLLHIMKEYNWDKISLLGHSMGSVLSFIFAATFPSKVDLFIGLDGKI